MQPCGATPRIRDADHVFLIYSGSEMNCLRRVAIHVLFAALGCLQVSAQQHRFEGCYNLDIEAWNDGSTNPDSTWWATRIRLSSAPGRGMFKEHERSVEVVPGAMPDNHPFAWWRALGSTRIEIVWSNGFTGFTVLLEGEPGGTLQGVARTFTDEVPGTSHTARVAASPVDCDAEIERARQVRHRYPRSVRLTTGESVVLDDSLRLALVQDSVASRSLRSGVAEVNYRRFILNGEPTELFQGAHRVEVTVGADRRINSIELFYPDTVSFEVLLRRLSAELGPPHTSDQPGMRLAGWSSRTAIISVVDDSRRAVEAKITIWTSY